MMIGHINMIITRRIKSELALLLTVAASVFMFMGVVTPNSADASVGIVSRWPATPQIVSNGATGTASVKFTPATDQNRLMLVVVATEYGAAQSPTFTVTYGGQAVTQLATNVTNNNKIWLGYLKESGIAAGSAGSKMLTVTTSVTSNLMAMYASAAVFSGVDQTTSTGTALTATTVSATTLSVSSLGVYGLTGNTGLSVYLANWNVGASTPYTGYTEQTDYTGANFNLASCYKMTTAGTEATITSTAALSAGAMVAVGINPATNVSTNNTCGACHGYPPVDAPGRNIGGMGQFSGSHGKHSGFEYGQAGLVCTKCHYNHTSNSHQSGFKNITGSVLSGSAYSLTKKVAVTNTNGAGTCSGVYCHSNARTVKRQYVPAASTRWGGPSSTCLTCHGGRTNGTGTYTTSASGFKLSTTHSQHIGKYPAANMNCQMCHSMTVINDAWTLRPYSSQVRHANGTVDVTFTDITYGGYTSYKSTAMGSGSNAKTCANISCHGGTTRSAWGESTINASNTCVHCHGVASYTGTGNTTANRKNFAPGWNNSGTSTDGISVSTDVRVGAHFVHLSSVHMAKLKCTECHTVPDSPFSGTHMASPRYNSQTLTFAQATSAKFNGVFPSYTSGTAVKAATCSTVYCHGAKMRNGDTSGSYRKPSWNMDLTGNTADTTTCGRCHGLPPIFGTTSSLHGGKTLTDCTTCHTSVVDGTGKIKNKALHINGKLEAPGSPCNGCHSAKSNDTYFAANSAHKLHIYTSMKWADYQDATETNIAKRSSEAAVADTYKFKCGVCHNSDATRPTYATHMNGNGSGDLAANQATQIYFGYYTTAGKTGAYVAGGALAGTDTKGTNKTWTAGSSTPGTSCMTTYCHSNGQDGATFVSGNPVSWSTTTRSTGNTRCTMCHGGQRGSSNPMNTGKHNRHMNNYTTLGASMFTCVSCHAGTVSSNTAILPASVRHVNKMKNFSGLYAGDNYNPVTKTCSAFYCHSDSKGRYVDPGTWLTGTGPKMCDGCHGRSANGSVSSTGGLGYPNYTSTAKGTFRANSHPKHITQLGITDTRGCAKCHRSTADRNFANRQHPLSSNHLDGNTNADLKPDRTAGISFTYNTGTKTCNNASCHRSGRIDKNLTANVQWGDTGTCRMCHGNRNSAFGGYSFSRSGFNLSTSHRSHLKYPAADMNCQTCHYKTATDAATFKPYTGALYHNNNKRNVYLAPAFGSYTAFKSYSSSNLPIPATNTKNCSNTSCHGGVTRNAWQKTTANNDNTCVHCHGVAGTASNLPNTAANRKRFAPGWAGTGTSTDGNSSSMDMRVGSHFKHLSSAYMKIRSCNECHAVPNSPFGGTHMEAPRYNSQTLTFATASSAKWDGVSQTQLAVFSGYTNGTAIKAVTCSSVYCHGNRLKNGDTGGANIYRKPYWNYSALINYSDPTVACGRCHGNPPSSVTGSHNGKAATVSCYTCHGTVVDAAGKIVNKALHINGIVNSTVDCMTCHATTNPKTKGTTGTIRVITGTGGDFVRLSRHVSNGTATQIVTKWDCVVCHMEGETTGSTGANHNETAGLIHLRNVDSPSVGWTINNKAMNETMRTDTDTFCLTCHDADGANGINVNATNTGLNLASTRSLTPFNTADSIKNGRDLTSGRTRVIDVKTQFFAGTGTGAAYNGNPSQHAVLGQRYWTNNAGWTTAAWNSHTLRNGTNQRTVRETARLHCSDCHLNETNAHGAVNAWHMLLNGVANDYTSDTVMGGVTITSTAVVCYKCHTQAQYDGAVASTASRRDHRDLGDNRPLTGAYGASTYSRLGSACGMCHAGGGWGNIHGMSGTYTAGGTLTKYRFFPGAWLAQGRDAGSGSVDADFTSTTVMSCYSLGANSNWSQCGSHTGVNTNLGAGYSAPAYTRGVKY